MYFQENFLYVFLYKIDIFINIINNNNNINNNNINNINNKFHNSNFLKKREMLQTNHKMCKIQSLSTIEESGEFNRKTTPHYAKQKGYNVIKTPKRRILVFDVETTGLIPNMDPITKEYKSLEEMPNIIQISFIVFNLYEFCIERTYNAYIKIKNIEKITEEITNLTGITQEKCLNEGIEMKEALIEFYNEYIHSDYVIAHNINFDKRMIMIELERNFLEIEKTCPFILNIFNPIFCKSKGIENYCTMMASINICNILIEKKSKKVSNKIVPVPLVEGETESIIISSTPPTFYKKYPKLSELYFCLFQSNPENLHNSLVDTLVCLRCFLKIKMNHEIHDKKYDFMLKTVMEMV